MVINWWRAKEKAAKKASTDDKKKGDV